MSEVGTLVDLSISRRVTRRSAASSESASKVLASLPAEARRSWVSGGHEHLVGELGEGGELLGAGLSAARRHVGALVPVENRVGHVEVGDVPETGFEIGECGHGGSLC